MGPKKGKKKGKGKKKKGTGIADTADDAEKAMINQVCIDSLKAKLMMTQ